MRLCCSGQTVTRCIANVLLLAELSYEEVKALLPTFGLTMIVCRRADRHLCLLGTDIAAAAAVQDETLPVDCFYVGNARSMMQFLYKCAFFTCQKQSPMH